MDESTPLMLVTGDSWPERFHLASCMTLSRRDSDTAVGENFGDPARAGRAPVRWRVRGSREVPVPPGAPQPARLKQPATSETTRRSITGLVRCPTDERADPLTVRARLKRESAVSACTSA